MTNRSDVTVAVNVVLASRVIPAGAKLLFLKTAYLEDPVRGCYGGSAAMAVLLGAEQESVERYWRHLVAVGLLRRGTSAGTRRSLFVAFPWTCRPEHAKPSPAEYQAAAERLDAWLAARGGWPARAAMPASGAGFSREKHPSKPASDTGFPREKGSAKPASVAGFEAPLGHEVRLGGSGGSLVSQSVTPTPTSTSELHQGDEPLPAQSARVSREKSRRPAEGGTVHSERETEETAAQQSLTLLALHQGNPAAGERGTALTWDEAKELARRAYRQVAEG